LKEKEVSLSSDDYGKDLAGVQALQRNHKGFEVKINLHVYVVLGCMLALCVCVSQCVACIVCGMLSACVS